MSSASEVGFTQQGTIDWVAFSNTVVPMSIGVLARLQGAGVQAITYAGIMQMVNHFSLPPLGLRRVEEAISKLPIYNSASQLLYFGFGHRSFFRQLTESVSGLKVIALSSLLAEAHSEDVAGLVLSSLWKKLGYPDDYQPSLQQFKAIVKACSGVFTSSVFPLLLGPMLPLRLRGSYDTAPCSDPEAIAAALVALFDVVDRRRDRIILVGGSEGAFFAAIAHWLFDLDVVVDDEVDGTELFATSIKKVGEAAAAPPKVRVKYTELSALSSVAVSDSTIVLSSTSELFQELDEKHRALRWRVSWDRCVSTAWPVQYKTVLGLRGPLSRFIRSFAHLINNITGLATSEVFQSSLARFLPEISALILDKDTSTGYVTGRGVSIYKAFQGLKRCCGCDECRNDSVSRSPWVKSGHCLVDFLWTIVSLALLLTSAIFDEGIDPIMPDINGLRDYWQFAPSKAGQDLNDMQLLKGPPPARYRMRALVSLFTYTAGPFGVEDDSELEEPIRPVAVSCSGVCFILDFVLSRSCINNDIGTDIGRIRVVRGQIGHYRSRGRLSSLRTYSYIVDDHSHNERLPEIDFTLAGSRDLQSSPDYSAAFGPGLEILEEVSESITDPMSLRLAYRLQSSKETIFVMLEYLIYRLEDMKWLLCDGSVRDSLDPGTAYPEDFGKIAIVSRGGSATMDLLTEVTATYWGDTKGNVAGELAALWMILKHEVTASPGSSPAEHEHSMEYAVIRRVRNHKLGLCCLQKAKKLKFDCGDPLFISII